MGQTVENCRLSKGEAHEVCDPAPPIVTTLPHQCYEQCCLVLGHMKREGRELRELIIVVF